MVMENENIDRNRESKMLQLIKFWTISHTENIKCVSIVLSNWFLTIKAYKWIFVYLIGASDDYNDGKNTYKTYNIRSEEKNKETDSKCQWMMNCANEY